MGSGFARALALAVLPLALTGVISGYTTFSADIAFTEARTELGFWGRGSYHPQPQVIAGTALTIQNLLDAKPDHPEFLSLQASLMVWQAFWSDDLQVRSALGEQAVAVQFLSLASRPAHRHGWSKMVEYASRTPAGEPQRQMALRRVALLSPKGSAEHSRLDR